MSQTLFASNASPSLPLLDANFNDNYGLANLFTTPTYTGTGTKFTVDATGNFTMTGSANFSMADTFSVKWGTGASYITGSTAGGFLRFGCGSIDRAQFDNSGNFMVGNTTATITPLNGVSIVAPLTGTQVAVGHASGTASGTTYLNCAYNGASIGNITQSGTAAVLYNTTSDRRLKKNIRSAPNAGAIIDSIKVRSFDWKGSDEHVSHGFVAQELQKIAPQAVKVGTHKGNPWGVDPSKLVALLVKEVQSLRARVAALEGK